MGINSMSCSQCEHYIEANAGKGKIYGCDRSKCVFEPNTKNDVLISKEKVIQILRVYSRCGLVTPRIIAEMEHDIKLIK